MSEPVLSRKRQGAQDAVDTLETFEAFEAFDKHERTHADPGSQLIRAQLLALIQKRFGRPVGE